MWCMRARVCAWACSCRAGARANGERGRQPAGPAGRVGDPAAAANCARQAGRGSERAAAVLACVARAHTPCSSCRWRPGPVRAAAAEPAASSSRQRSAAMAGAQEAAGGRSAAASTVALCVLLAHACCALDFVGRRMSARGECAGLSSACATATGVQRTQRRPTARKSPKRAITDARKPETPHTMRSSSLAYTSALLMRLMRAAAPSAAAAALAKWMTPPCTTQPRWGGVAAACAASSGRQARAAA